MASAASCRQPGVARAARDLIPTVFTPAARYRPCARTWPPQLHTAASRHPRSARPGPDRLRAGDLSSPAHARPCSHQHCTSGQASPAQRAALSPPASCRWPGVARAALGLFPNQHRADCQASPPAYHAALSPSASWRRSSLDRVARVLGPIDSCRQLGVSPRCGGFVFTGLLPAARRRPYGGRSSYHTEFVRRLGVARAVLDLVPTGFVPAASRHWVTSSVVPTGLMPVACGCLDRNGLGRVARLRPRSARSWLQQLIAGSQA